MNVRIDKGGVRFRIVPDDLMELLNGKRLKQGVTIGSQNISYEIAPVPSGEMTLAVQDMRFTLLVPQTSLQELRDLGRSKKGISVQQDNVEVSLQIDLKSHPAR